MGVNNSGNRQSFEDFNQIAAPLTSRLRFGTARQSLTVTGEPSTMEVDGDTKVDIGGGAEVEIVRDESQIG